MDLHQVMLLLATFFCSLVAGFVFAFAVVVMPGIGKLGDREFLRAFHVIDGVIQNNQPWFAVVWIGSILAVIAAAVVGVAAAGPTVDWLALLAAFAWLIGVQLPTFTINIPLNNAVQALDLDSLDESAVRAERERFEGRWVRWNSNRTVVACAATLMLLIALLRSGSA